MLSWLNAACCCLLLLGACTSGAQVNSSPCLLLGAAV